MPDIFAPKDPFRKLNDIGDFDPFDTSASPRAKRAAYRQPLSPEDQESFGSKALSAGASGLGAVLGALDKPGQAVRGVLAGKGLGSLKHLIPFSHAMGITTDADSTTGRDLTDKYGLTRKGDNGWGSWGVGLAADIATDPLTYSTFGAKHAFTGVGKVVQKTGALKGWGREALLQGYHATESGLTAAGKSANDIAHMVNQGKRIAMAPTEAAAAAAGYTIKPGEAMSSLAKIKAPFGPQWNVGTGKFAQGVARGLDRFGGKLKYGNPVSRAVNSLFSPDAQEAVHAVTQRGAAKYGVPAREAGQELVRRYGHDLAQHIDTAISTGVAPEHDLLKAAITLAEGSPHGLHPDLVSAATPIAEHLKEARARYLKEGAEWGVAPRGHGDDFIDYVHRQSLEAGDAGRALQIGGKRSNLFPTTSGANIGRQSIFRNIPGGQTRINEWFDKFAGLGSKREIRATAKAIRADIEKDVIAGGNLLKYTPEAQLRFDKQARMLAKRIGKANEGYRSIAATATDPMQTGLPFFSPDVFANQAQREAQHAKTIQAAKTAIGTIADVARPFSADAGHVPIPKLLRQLGLQSTGGDILQKAGPGIPAILSGPNEGALMKVHDLLARLGAKPADTVANISRKDLERTVGRWGVSADHAAQIVQDYAKWKAPEQIKSTIKGFDSLTNAFKSLVYPIWLPSHVRNASTAGFNNLFDGVRWRDYLDQAMVATGRGKRDLSHLVPGGGAGMSTADQLAAIRRQQYIAAGIGGEHAANEVAGSAKQALVNQNLGAGPTRITPFVPGVPGASNGSIAKDGADLILKRGLLGSLKATGQTAWNAVRDPLAFSPHTWGSGRLGAIFEPLGIRGVNGAAKDTLPAVVAGRTLGTNIENFFRGAQYNSHIRRGATPSVAADAINRLHFDYGNLTGFEKNVMRRVMPFYTYFRRNLPLQVGNALHHPGVFNAQYKPFHQTSGDDKGYVPEYLRSGVAMPTGPEVDGKRQYISKLGLPGEEAFEKVHMRNGLPDIRNTALDFLSGMNPILKAPLEQLFDTQFHTQRKLSDLKSQGTASAIGKLLGDDNPQLLAQVLANSPLTRFISSADKLGDPRKSLLAKAANMLTGVRVTDVDTNKQRAVELRAELERMMQGHPNISRYGSYYVKPEDVAELTPEEIEMMRAYSGIQDQARAYAKSQRQPQRIGIRP